MKFNKLMFHAAVAVSAFLIGTLAVWQPIWTAFQCSDVTENRQVLPKTIPPISTEEYEVIAAVLAQAVEDRNFVVGEIPAGNCSNCAEYIDLQSFQISRSTADDYQQRNGQSHRFENQFPSVTILTLARENELFPKGGGGWEPFRDAFPAFEGIAYFSRVGLNPDKTEAYVIAEYQCRFTGCNNNYGGIYSLKKSAGQWKILHKIDISPVVN